MDVNHLYFLHYIKQFPHHQSFRVLDYGCGRGETVALLRQEHIECYGVDVFIEGTSYAELSDTLLFKEEIIRHIGLSGEIPFPDHFFDVIISNQVFEHVPDKEAVIRSLDRVLKPGGLMYHHFPSREVMREGHIGIPFVHWMNPGMFRLMYTQALCRIGLGYHREGRQVDEWARSQLQWLDQFCFYETYGEILRTWGRDYRFEHRELEYCQFRAQRIPLLGSLLRIGPLRGFYERLFRRLGFMALQLSRRDDRSTSPTVSN
jgi:SAM-dependent methyltransferase